MEVEHKHKIRGQEGMVRLLAFSNRENMGRFSDAIAAFESDPQKNATTCTGFTEAFRTSFPRLTSSPTFYGVSPPRALNFQRRLTVATSMKSPLVSTGRGSYPPLLITTLNLMDRQDRSAHLPLPRGRAMPASAKPLARSLPRLAFFSRVITPLERRIQTGTSGIPLTSSILRIMTSLALPIRLAAGTLCSSEPVSKKIPRKSGSSNSNLKATGWPLQMTTSTPAVGRLRLRPIPARVATSATNSIWLLNTR